MAEGLAKKYLSHYYIKSAGTNPEKVNPMAIEVMNEININISNHYSKSIADEQVQSFDLAITLCGDARDKCLNINNLAIQHIHWDIIDPSKTQGPDNKKLTVFRNVRNQIEKKIIALENNLT